MIGKFLRRRMIEHYGWESFTKEEQNKLLSDLLDIPIIDLSKTTGLPLHDVISVNEISYLIHADKNIRNMLIKKYGDKISINHIIQFLQSAPLMQELILNKFANKVNRVLSYLIFKVMAERELTDDEHYLLALLLSKFSAQIGCPTPEMYEEKCKTETEEMVAINKPKEEDKP